MTSARRGRYSRWGREVGLKVLVCGFPLYMRYINTICVYRSISSICVGAHTPTQQGDELSMVPCALWQVKFNLCTQPGEKRNQMTNQGNVCTLMLLFACRNNEGYNTLDTTHTLAHILHTQQHLYRPSCAAGLCLFTQQLSLTFRQPFPLFCDLLKVSFLLPSPTFSHAPAHLTSCPLIPVIISE